MSSKPLESRAKAPVARPGSISGTGTANAGAENALRTSTKPTLQETAEIIFRGPNLIVTTSFKVELIRSTMPRTYTWKIRAITLYRIRVGTVKFLTQMRTERG
jgi:hypothetical protein